MNAKVYYNLDRSLPQNLDSIVALNKLKSDYNMATTHFVVVQEDLSDAALNAMISEMEDVEGVNTVLSTNSALGLSVPDTFLPDQLNENFTQNCYKMLMINSRYQTASDEVRSQIDALRHILNKYDSEGYLTCLLYTSRCV